MNHFSLLSRGFVLAVCVVLGSGLPAAADPLADPYLDAIAPDSQVVIDNPSAMLGVPDGQYAKVTGQQFKALIVDLGAGEEGVGDLEVSFYNPPYAFIHQVFPEFLDANGNEVGHGALFISGTGPGTATVENSSITPYRYIRILTGLETFYFDSMKTAALAQP